MRNVTVYFVFYKIAIVHILSRKLQENTKKLICAGNYILIIFNIIYGVLKLFF